MTQIIEYKPDGDKVLITVHQHSLRNLGGNITMEIRQQLIKQASCGLKAKKQI